MTARHVCRHLTGVLSGLSLAAASAGFAQEAPLPESLGAELLQVPAEDVGTLIEGPADGGPALIETPNPAYEEEAELAGATGVGARLRGLDKLTGETTDIELSNGETTVYARFDVTLKECRYPAEDPSRDAFAYVVIHDRKKDERRFAGWMVASSPALNALDDARYDVWLLSCRTSDGETSGG